jgi:hypothetical protein
MLGLVALFLNVLPAFSVPTIPVPNAVLALRAEHVSKRTCAALSKRHRDMNEPGDPIEKQGCADAISKRHQCCRAAEELDS